MKLKKNNYESFIKEIIVKAGKETLKYFGKAKVQYSKNYDGDIVTQADLASNKIIVNAIKKKFPDHGIISEEEKDYNSNAEYVWVIDPLDGTSNFRREQPMYVVLIALMKNRETILGAAYAPYFNDLYFAKLNGGAFKNGKQIHCSDRKDLTHATGCGSLMIDGPVADKIEKFSKSSRKYSYWILETGSVAYDAMQVAQGHIHWHFCPPFKSSGGIWDTAATSLILKESGCKVTNFKGEEWTIKDVTEVLAANPFIHKTIMEIIK